MRKATETMLQRADNAKVDLTQCDKELIHIPGNIQPHGMVFALQIPDLFIVQVSAKFARFIGEITRNIVAAPA